MTSPYCHRFAVFTAAATLALIGIGGLVTSHGVGLAVLDWPNTYGYNMFFFPVSRWVGGIFYEHTHRLAASGVGLLSVALALWLHGRSARPWMRRGGLALLAAGMAFALSLPGHWADGVVLGGTGLALFGAGWVWPRCEPAPKWVRWLGVAAFLAVVLQGVLGGLRVVLLKDQIGIFHAALAQLFFVLVCAIALVTSRWWNEPSPQPAIPGVPPRGANPALRWLFSLTTLLIFAQLLLGATMRHQHAGLAIPDFPLAYGKIWPATDPASVAHYNQRRIEVEAANPTTAFQIKLQMAHRIGAGLILVAVAACAWKAGQGPIMGTRGACPSGIWVSSVGGLSKVWLGLILGQVFLGAATIWSDKAADIATAHVVVGALSLALGTILSILCWREAMPAWAQAASPWAPEAWRKVPLGAQPHRV